MTDPRDIYRFEGDTLPSAPPYLTPPRDHVPPPDDDDRREGLGVIAWIVAAHGVLALVVAALAWWPS